MSVSDITNFGGEPRSTDRTQADREALVAHLRAHLDPTQVAIEHALLRQYDPTTRKDMQHVLRVVVSKTDRKIVEATIEAVFEIADGGNRRTSVAFVSAAASPVDRDLVRRLDLEFLGSQVAINEIVVVLDEVTGPDPAPLFDAQVDLTRLTGPDVAATLRHVFGEEAKLDPGWSWPTGAPLSMLDLVCKKATTVETALAFLNDIADTGAVGPSDYAALSDPLADMVGYGVAKVWARRFVEDLAAFRSGALPWREVDSTLVLTGPPGTGKTEFARRVAQAAGIPIVATSYSTWQRSEEGHLGDVLRAIHNDFSHARSVAPSILFVDEIDSLPVRGSEGRNRSWYFAVINALLEEIDGLSGRDGVAVMAACNRGDRLDPALTRAGRLNRTVRIDLPDATDLSRILASKLDGAVSPESVRPFCDAVAGRATGADMVQVAREARRTARQAGRAVRVADVQAAILPPDTRSQEVRRVIAIHEAGHVVAALASGVVPYAVSLVDSITGGGAVRFDPVPVTEISADTVRREILVTLSGRAAEEIVIGSVSAGAGGHDDSDLANATRLATDFEGAYAFGASLVFRPRPEQNAVEAILRRAYSDALALMVRHQSAVTALAELLMSSGYMNKDRITKFAARHDLLGAVAQAPSEGVAR
ncbi:AAA family ATPase [Aureimonas jatrophae]|uniref:ATP-dependent Zn proteases n=1 Tax=Aureimonas jatrophae TaxID=1166073 RepID=A0A1H0J9Q2_9HYPH|nr:AAA family ATPase [Aureimonas jatrophae]MBB3951517.1 hypothetical protein [Aureimonas jatrophae]SDO40495.1 ATP-dependent Zn proteases [Aureimonas jatrophae]